MDIVEPARLAQIEEIVLRPSGGSQFGAVMEEAQELLFNGEIKPHRVKFIFENIQYTLERIYQI